MTTEIPRTPPAAVDGSAATNGADEAAAREALQAEFDAIEAEEWRQSLHDVFYRSGPERVAELLSTLQIEAQREMAQLPVTSRTPYVNTIPIERQPPYPGNREIEQRIKSFVRWNAMAMVVDANNRHEGIGGHISTYASAATLYEVGFNHFFRGRERPERRRPDLHPGPRLAGHLRPRVPRGPVERGAAVQLPPRAGRGRRAAVVPAPVADGALLEVPHRLDGPRAADGDLPGPVHALPRRPRHQGALRREGVDLHRRR